MSEDKKPREFWIDTTMHEWEVYNEKFISNYPDSEVIHVIEHSAYDALAKENEELKMKFELTQKWLTEMIEADDKFEHEANALRKENEELKQLRQEVSTLDTSLGAAKDIIDWQEEEIEGLKVKIAQLIKTMEQFPLSQKQELELQILEAKTENASLRTSLKEAVEALTKLDYVHWEDNCQIPPTYEKCDGCIIQEALAKIKARHGDIE